MSRHIDRWLNHATRVESRLRDLYLSRGPIYGMTHDAMLAERAELYATIPRGAPSWVWTRLRAVSACLHDEMMRREIRWQLYLDGSPVESSAVPSGAWCRITGRHEWHNGKPLSGEAYVGPSSCAVDPRDPRRHIAPCV